MSKEVKIPENIRELTRGYMPIDFKLMPEEEIHSVLKMKLSSKIRDFIVVLLTGLLGYSLYIFFNSKLSVYDALPPIIIFLTTYFIWHYRITRDIKHLFWNILKYSFYLLMSARNASNQICTPSSIKSVLSIVDGIWPTFPVVKILI